MENVLINFVADPAGLQPGIDGLEQLEMADAEVAAQSKKTMDAYRQRNKEVADGAKQSTSSVEKLTNSFKNLDKSMVGGAYKTTLKQLQKEIGGTVDEFKQLAIAVEFSKKRLAELKPDSAEWKELNAQVQAGEQLLKTFGEQEQATEKKSVSLRAELKALKQEIATKLEAGASQQEVQGLIDRAGELDDTLKDINATVANVGSDTKNLDGLISLAGGGIGVFSALQGVIALTGNESEEFQQALVKLNGAMALLQGLTQVQNVLLKESAATQLIVNDQRKIAVLQTQLQTAAESKNIIIKNASIIAQKGLNAVMALSPTGALLLAIGAIAGAMLYFSSSTKKAKVEVEELNQAMEESIQRSQDLKKAFTAPGNSEIDKLNRIIAARKAAGASEQELFKLEEEVARKRNELSKNRISVNTGDDFLKDLDAFEKATRKKYNDLISLNQQINEIDFDISKAGTQKEIDNLKKSREGIKSEFSLKKLEYDQNAEDLKEYYDSLGDLENSYGQQKKFRDEKAKDAEEKRKEQLERILKAEFELLKIEKQKQIDFLNSQGGAEGFSVSVREESFRKAFVLEQEILIAQRDLQLKEEKLTGKERELIKQQTADALVAIELDYNGRIAGVQSAFAREVQAQQEAVTQIVVNESMKAKRALEDAFKNTSRFNTAEEQAEIQNLLNKYKAGLIGKEAYEKGKAEIQEKYSRKNIEGEIKALEKILELTDISEDARIAAEERLYQLKKELRDKDTADQEAALAKGVADTDEATKKQLEIRALAQQAAINLAQIAFGISAKGYQREEERVKQLYDTKRISEVEYNNQLKELKRKQAADEKAMAIFQVLVNQGPAAVKGLVSGGFAGFAAALGLVFSMLAAVTSEEVPQFKKGEVRIDGPGTQTSDSIFARISKDESVINARQTLKHEDALRAINEDRFSQYLVKHELPKYYQNMTMPAVPDVVTTSAPEPIDYDRLISGLATVIEGLPRPGLSVDEDGFKSYLQQGNSVTEYKNKKLNL